MHLRRPLLRTHSHIRSLPVLQRCNFRNSLTTRKIHSCRRPSQCSLRGPIIRPAVCLLQCLLTVGRAPMAANVYPLTAGKESRSTHKQANPTSMVTSRAHGSNINNMPTKALYTFITRNMHVNPTQVAILVLRGKPLQSFRTPRIRFPSIRMPIQVLWGILSPIKTPTPPKKQTCRRLRSGTWFLQHMIIHDLTRSKVIN